MSSEEEYYDLPDYHYERRSSNRARRRGSGQGRRSRKRENGHYGHKSRRSNSWTLNSSRIMACCMLLLMVCYEFLILKGPLTESRSKTKTTASTAYNTPPVPSPPRTIRAYADQFTNEGGHKNPVTEEKERAPPPSPPSPSSVARIPISSEKGGSTAARIKAALEPIQQERSVSSYTPLKKHRHSSTSDSVKAISNREPVEASTLKLEMKAADEDDSSDSSRIGRSKRKSSASKSSSHSSEMNSPAERDIEPPKPRKRIKPRDRGAEPGAGENFWQWFQDTKGNENGGVGSNLNCPTDNQRLCQMFYKYLRKYKIRTVFDVSCSTNLEWISEVLQKAGNELWGFKYYCSATEEDKMESAKEKLGSMKFVEFIPDQWWRDGYPDDTELLFAWDILPHIAYGRVWNFFVKAKKQDIKYILVDNYPGILNDPSPKRNYLNVRKHPFRFPAAKEVVQNVTEPGETAKRQLLFYESAMLPDNLQ